MTRDEILNPGEKLTIQLYGEPLTTTLKQIQVCFGRKRGNFDYLHTYRLILQQI